MYKVNQVYFGDQIPFFRGSETQYKRFCLGQISLPGNRQIPPRIRSVQTPDGQYSACIHGKIMFFKKFLIEV